MVEPAPTPKEIERWLVTRVAEHLDLPPADVDPTAAFADLGIDSSAAVKIASQLEAEWDIALTETTLFDYPTIQDLAPYLAGTAI
jgi:acyl carrier protein